MNTTIIILLGLLVLALSFRKSIAIYITKLVYGEYSRQFVLKYKKITRKKPHPYCFKDDFYYHILAIHKAMTETKIYQSNKRFDFEHLDFGKNLKDTLSENSNPDCFTISEDKVPDFSVVGYKSRMFHSNEKTLLYHCSDSYFMGEFVFSSLSENTPALILEMLQKEYNPNIEAAKNFSIKDQDGHVLYFTDTGFFLSLKFFNTNNDIIQKLVELAQKSSDENKPPLENIRQLEC